MDLRLVAVLTTAAIGCFGCTAPIPGNASPAPAAPPSTTSVPVADLPSAPPIDQWVVKGSDFQRTLDLNVETALINLGVATAAADEQAARSFAYHFCSGLRTHRASPPDLVKEAYPSADFADSVGLGLAANAYCLDAL
jgi:hypothetical protein